MFWKRNGKGKQRYAGSKKNCIEGSLKELQKKNYVPERMLCSFIYIRITSFDNDFQYVSAVSFKGFLCTG